MELRDKIRKQEQGECDSVTGSDDQSFAKLTLGSAEVSASCQKVIGLAWDCEKGVIKFNFRPLAAKTTGKRPTRRNILSTIAGLSEPVGVCSSVGVSMRILFQNLCAANVDWDQELDGEPTRRWEAWDEDLAQTNRCLYKQPRNQVQEHILVGFADASTKAYCAMIYLVYITQTGTYATLIAAKTRVVPMKTMFIPRLELMATLILARLMTTVRKALETSLKVSEVKYWSESKTVLWHYCPTDQNPADIGSRGCLASKLKDNGLWWHESEWLSMGRDQWPPQTDFGETKESHDEEKKTMLLW